MTRNSDALANILITLSELDRSSIISPETREKVEGLKKWLEAELQKSTESDPKLHEN